MTTTQMLQHLLKDKGSICGGNIGTPLAKMDIEAKRSMEPMKVVSDFVSLYDG